jgi:glycosyltransferase involved in cell wall biosynthesis
MVSSPAAIRVGGSDSPLGMRVSVVIPTFNEAAAIERVLDDIPASLVSEVLVVDGGSTDGTREIAAARGARVIVEERRGYGRACLAGVAAADDPDTVVFLDGDYSDRPRELARLIEPIREGHADVVLGSRLAEGLAPGAMPWHAVFGNRVAVKLIGWLYGISLTDLGPFRAARYRVLQALDLREMTYGWAVEMVTRGAMRGYRVREVPVSYHPRIGVSKISGTLRGSIGAAFCILSGIVKHRMRAATNPVEPGPAS